MDNVNTELTPVAAQPAAAPAAPETALMRVAKPFTFTHQDGTRQPFAAGDHPNTPKSFIENWFVKLHLVDPDLEPPPSAGGPSPEMRLLGATQEENIRLKADTEAAATRISELSESRDATERERAAAVAALEPVTAERDALKAENAALKVERDALKAERDALKETAAKPAASTGTRTGK